MTPAVDAPSVPGMGDPIFDEAAALALVEGDRDFLRELLTMFVSAAPQLVVDARAACGRADATAAARAAHRLRGNATQIGGRQVGEHALVVEEQARAGELAAAAASLDPLATAVETLCARVRATLAR